MTVAEPFSKIIQMLADESRPFPASYLHNFSDISPSELKSVMQVWPSLSDHRKESFLEDVEYLSESDTLVSFEDLARPLLSDNNPVVRIKAMSLLWECTDPKLISIYTSILKTDSDPDARAASASSLGQYIYLGEVGEIADRLLHEVEQSLLSIVGEGNPDLIRRRALEALGASSRTEVPSLIEAAYHRVENEWKISALHAMGRSSDENWEKHILAHLYDQDEEIRTEAINAAGKLELDSARTPLLDLLEDEEDTEIRREIIWTLSCIGGEGVKSKLEELLDLEDEDEVDFLEEALENLLLTEDLNQFTLLDLDPGLQDDD